MKEVQLTENQAKVIAQIQLEKQSLQAEFDRVIKRETEALILVAESNGVVLTKGLKVELKEGGILVFGDSSVEEIIEPEVITE